jgi:addiction module HigA family antidote
MAKPFKILRDKMSKQARAAAETKTRELLAGLKRTRKYKSRLDQTIHETAQDLYELGAFDKKTMREFDASYLKEVIGIQKVPLTQHRDNYELPAEVDFSDAVRGKFSKRGSKPHPGEILKHDFMDPQKITIAKLSKGTGIGQQDLRNIIKGEAGIDVHDAKALGEFFKNRAEYWINLHAGTQPKKNLTRSFRETVRRRATEDPKFRKGLLTEAVDAMLCGEVNVAKTLLRDYISSGKIDTTALRKSFDNFIRMAEAIQREVGAKGDDMCVECHLQENLRNPKFKAAYEREGKKIDRAVRKTTAKASAKKKK